MENGSSSYRPSCCHACRTKLTTTTTVVNEHMIVSPRTQPLRCTIKPVTPGGHHSLNGLTNIHSASLGVIAHASS